MGLRGFSGFDPPSWQDLVNGARPPFHDLENQEPGVVLHRQQHEAASRVERDVRRACSRTGPLGRKVLPLESAGKVEPRNVVRDMDLPVPNAHDARRLEIVADGLPLHGGVQLAGPAPWVSESGHVQLWFDLTDFSSSRLKKNGLLQRSTSRPQAAEAQAALRSARTKSKVLPVNGRVEACKGFLERAKKRQRLVQTDFRG